MKINQINQSLGKRLCKTAQIDSRTKRDGPNADSCTQAWNGLELAHGGMAFTHALTQISTKHQRIPNDRTSVRRKFLSSAALWQNISNPFLLWTSRHICSIHVMMKVKKTCLRNSCILASIYSLIDAQFVCFGTHVRLSVTINFRLVPTSSSGPQSARRLASRRRASTTQAPKRSSRARQTRTTTSASGRPLIC